VASPVPERSAPDPADRPRADAGRRTRWLRSLALAVFAGGLLAAANPISFQRFSLPGPVAGVLAKVDLRDPRVSVNLALAEVGRADDPADCSGRLDVPSAAARRHDFSVAINASYFSAAAKPVGGRKVPYFIGNCARPVGWHFSAGQLRTRPSQPHIQAVLVVRATGQLSLHARLDQLPPDTRCAVGGSALVLEKGRVIGKAAGKLRHPRSAVGLSEDGAALFLVAVDGRQEGHSRGATLAELGHLLKKFGAHDALNLDGGGSTALVAKDPATGVFTVINRPSGRSPDLLEAHQERPVVDILGVVVREPEKPAAGLR